MALLPPCVPVGSPCLAHWLCPALEPPGPVTPTSLSLQGESFSGFTQSLCLLNSIWENAQTKVEWGKGLEFVKGQNLLRGIMYSVYFFHVLIKYFSVSQETDYQGISLHTKAALKDTPRHWQGQMPRSCSLERRGVRKHVHPVCSQ